MYTNASLAELTVVIVLIAKSNSARLTTWGQFWVTRSDKPFHRSDTIITDLQGQLSQYSPIGTNGPRISYGIWYNTWKNGIRTVFPKYCFSTLTASTRISRTKCLFADSFVYHVECHVLNKWATMPMPKQWHHGYYWNFCHTPFHTGCSLYTARKIVLILLCI